MRDGLDRPAAVWERPDGVTELIFGAYDSAVHFVDASTGQDLRPRIPDRGHHQGSVSLDPDGFPLLYFGSRDNQLRILALDREAPTVLWSMDANEVNGIWNDDWDSNPRSSMTSCTRGRTAGSSPSSSIEAMTPRARWWSTRSNWSSSGYNEALLANSGRNVSIEAPSWSSTRGSTSRTPAAGSWGWTCPMSAMGMLDRVRLLRRR